MRTLLKYLDQWGIFILVVSGWIIFQPADIGELVFLFVYENICALLGLFLYLITVDAFILYKRSKTKGAIKLLAPFANLGVYLLYFGVLILLILFINQVSVELLIAYMCPTGDCSSRTLQILQTDFFLSSNNLGALSNAFPMGFISFTTLIIGFAFTNLSVKAYDDRNKKTAPLGIIFFMRIAASAFAMAVSVLIISMVWTIFNEFGALNKGTYIALLIALRLLYLGLMRIYGKLKLLAQ